MNDRDLDLGLLPALVATLGSNEKIAWNLVTKALESVFAFKLRTFDLVSSPLGGAFAFQVRLKACCALARLAIAENEVINVHKVIEHILADME